MTPQEIVQIIASREDWLDNVRGSVPADRSLQDLQGLSVDGANLDGARMSPQQEAKQRSA